MVPVQIKPNHIMPMDSTNFYLIGGEVATWDHCVYYILEIALIMLSRARKLDPFGDRGYLLKYMNEGKAKYYLFLLKFARH
jgi:hypothetical protein